mmetsp:Transcript_2837/g.11366  ORF Transcript_2837/g.11366 Transcript_2837/m.11366 type:complete len:220 (-) Transcript_2837:1402-2061(-)
MPSTSPMPIVSTLSKAVAIKSSSVALAPRVAWAPMLPTSVSSGGGGSSNCGDIGPPLPAAGAPAPLEATSLAASAARRSSASSWALRFTSPDLCSHFLRDSERACSKRRRASASTVTRSLRSASSESASSSTRSWRAPVVSASSASAHRIISLVYADADAYDPSSMASASACFVVKLSPIMASSGRMSRTKAANAIPIEFSTVMRSMPTAATALMCSSL